MTTIEIVKSDEQILYTKEDVIKLLEQQKKELVERQYMPKVNKFIYTIFDELQEQFNEHHEVIIDVDKFVEDVDKCLL